MSKVDLQHYGRPAPAPRIGRESLGTWLDGAYGWHNVYRVVDAAVSYGFQLQPGDDFFLDHFKSSGGTKHEETALEISDEATDYLQSLVTDDHLVFVWDAGELSLQEVEDESQ